MELLRIEEVPSLSELAKVVLLTGIPERSEHDIVRSSIMMMGGHNVVQGDPEFALMVCLERMVDRDIHDVLNQKGIRERFKLAVRKDIWASAASQDPNDVINKALGLFMESYVKVSGFGNEWVKLADAVHFGGSEDEGDGWLKTNWKG